MRREAGLRPPRVPSVDSWLFQASNEPAALRTDLGRQVGQNAPTSLIIVVLIRVIAKSGFVGSAEIGLLNLSRSVTGPKLQGVLWIFFF